MIAQRHTRDTARHRVTRRSRESNTEEQRVRGRAESDTTEQRE